MKASRAQQLTLRRQLLVLQAQLQRLQLAHDSQALMASLRPANAAPRLWEQLRGRPSLVLVGIAALAASRWLGTRRMLRHALAGWRLWQAWRQ